MNIKFIKIITCFLVFIPVFALAAGNLSYKIYRLDGEALNNAEKRLDLQIGNHAKKLSSAEIQAFMLVAPKTIKEAVQPFGYFDAKISKRISCNSGRCNASFIVSSGRPVKVRIVKFKTIGMGRKDSRLNEFNYKKYISEGDQLNTVKYQELKSNYLNYLISLGYLKAKISNSNLFINRREHYANVTLIFDTDQMFKFGKVTFSKSPMNNSFLQKYVPFKSYDNYDRKKLQELQDALNGSNHFSSVSVTPEIEKAKDSVVPIFVDLKLKKGMHYDFGVGFGTDTGPRGLLGIQARHITKNGQYFKGKVRASAIDTTGSATYVIPGKNPATDQYNVNLSVSHQSQNLGSSFLQKLGLFYSTLFHGWHQNIGFYVLNERSTLEDDPSINNTLLVPNAAWSYLQTDNVQRPNNGYKLSFSTRGATKALGSTINFFQAFANAKFLYTFKPSQTRFVLRLQLGLTAIDDIRLLPFSLQAFAGGAESVRGYGFNGIGPGKYLSVGSFELQQRVVNNWYAIGFVDTGSVNDIAFKDFQTGVGGGIMWRSPIGSIKLTAAQAVSLRDKPWKIQFSMGTEL